METTLRTWGGSTEKGCDLTVPKCQKCPVWSWGEGSGVREARWEEASNPSCPEEILQNLDLQEGVPQACAYPGMPFLGVAGPCRAAGAGSCGSFDPVPMAGGLPSLALMR